MNYVTNYLTCTAMTPIVILRQNAEESHIKRNPSDFYLSVAKTPHPSLPQVGEGALFFCSLLCSGRVRVGSDSLRKIIASHPTFPKHGKELMRCVVLNRA